jgi:LysM repeat protein
MKMRHPLVIISVLLSVLFMAGCATDREAQTQSIRADASLLSVTNSVPGSTYEVRVYVIAAGDTVAKIARKFGISIADFEAINPSLNPTRLKIGQKVRVYEKLTE